MRYDVFKNGGLGVCGSQGLLVLLYFWVNWKGPLLLPASHRAACQHVSTPFYPQGQKEVEQRDCVTEGGVGLPGQMGRVIARRGGTSLECEGHPPLLMLDQRCPCPPAQDGGRRCPRGTAATVLCEQGGQCKIQLLFERVSAT